MSDGTQQGIGAERALRTIVGGEPPPGEDEGLSPEQWLRRLEAKDDGIDGYDDHAEVMAKYIVEAYRRVPGLVHAPNVGVYLWEGDEGQLLVPGLSDVLKRLYPEGHPFRRALSEATGFTWGWAFNIARYALGLPPQPNPAIVTVNVP